MKIEVKCLDCGAGTRPVIFAHQDMGILIRTAWWAKGTSLVPKHDGSSSINSENVLSQLMARSLLEGLPGRTFWVP